MAMNETEYLNTCEYGPHYMKMVHTMAPRSNFALTFPINIQLSQVQQVSLKPIFAKVYSASSVFIHEKLTQTNVQTTKN